MTKIAFIGLGIMGSRMAGHLIAENQVTVWNRSKEKAEALVAAGAVWADSPKEAAEKADVIFTMLADPDAVEAVAFGENGVLEGAHPGSLWVDSSTVNPKFTQSLAQRAKAQGVRFLEAPVSGSRPQAQNRELVFLLGGAENDVQEITPLLERMGKKVLHFGPHGNATVMKLILNQFLATTLASFAESVHAGTLLGLDKKTIIDVMISSPLTPPYLGFKSERMKSGDYEADFPLRLMQKDLQMMNETAYSVKAKMPISSSARESYLAAVSAGLGDLDMSAILRYLEKGS